MDIRKRNYYARVYRRWMFRIGVAVMAGIVLWLLYSNRAP